MKSFATRTIFLLLACIGTRCIEAAAQPTQIERYGVSFPVTSLRPTGAGQVLVTLQTGEQLVTETRLASFISQEYFSNRVLFDALPLDKVLTFIVGALSAEDLPAAQTAIEALIRYGDLSDPVIADFLASLPNGEKEISFLKSALKFTLEGSTAPIFTALLLEKIGLEDLEWIRTNHPSALYSYEMPLRSVIRNHIFSLLRKQSIEDAKKVQKFQSAVFGNDDKEALRFSTLFAKLEAQKADGDLVEQITVLSKNDPEIKKYFEPLFAESVQKRIEDLLADGKAEKALDLLAQTDVTRRTPKTHELTEAAIVKLSTQSTFLAENPSVLKFVGFLSDKDPHIRDAVLLYIEQTAMRMSAYPDRAISILSALSVIRPDPNILNDQIRVSLAVQRLEAGDSSSAKIYLQQVITPLTISQRLDLFTARIKGSKFIFSLGIVVVLTVCSLCMWLLFFRAKRSRRIQAARTTKTERDTVEEEAPERPRPAFVTSHTTPRRRTSHLPMEYLEALSDLGLQPEATLKDVKAAFRAKMKDIHPDAVGHKEESTVDFINTKQAYEVILETRKRLGLDPLT